MSSSRKTMYTKPEPCAHLAAYRKKLGVGGYTNLRNLLGTDPDEGVATGWLRSRVSRCDLCSGHRGRLYLCLVCSSVSCSGHALAHLRSNAGHEIAVDVERAELFCCACADQVYDPEFDRAIMGAHAAELPACRESCGSKRGRPGAPAAPPEQDDRALFPWGLRGLNNLGNTCFMNSVLQVLLHTSPLRNHFLTGRHNQEVCRRRRRRKGLAAEAPCLACDVGGMFSAVFSGDRTPYSPARLLYGGGCFNGKRAIEIFDAEKIYGIPCLVDGFSGSIAPCRILHNTLVQLGVCSPFECWWQHAANLASYEQQDAHEFFISMLDGIHEKEQSNSQNTGIGDCHCIAHRVFSGVLRSDVMCTVCGFTSTTYDPYVDLSLDLEPSNSTTKSTDKTSESLGTSTLTGCLDLFTKLEKLGSDQKLYCQRCEMRQDSLKQMSIRRLPLVLCLHIKRFEHSPVWRMPKKIDQYLQFPCLLDMTPYLSSSILRNRFGNRIFAFEGDGSDISSELSSEFEVFAIVTHLGKLESGHYVTYLRLRNQWYKCDDAWITRVSEEVVRASQGYMMYYVQKVLYHKASEDMNCLLLSPSKLTHLAQGVCLSASACG